MLMSPRNIVIDIAKLIAAFLVIAIHAHLWEDVDESLYIIQRGINDLAVPFFAICTGFYVKAESIFFQWKKVFILYVFFVAVYFLYILPTWLDNPEVTVRWYLGWVQDAILVGPYYHLWYLLHLLYALPLFYLVQRFVKIKFWGIIAVLLLLIGLAYSGSIAIFSAQFTILPVLLMGGALRMIVNQVNIKYRWVTMVVALFIASIAPLISSYFIFLVPCLKFIRLACVAFLFLTILYSESKKKFDFPLGRLSIIIYCIHPMFCGLFFGHISSFLTWFYTSLLSFVAGVLWIYIHRLIKHSHNG